MSNLPTSNVQFFQEESISSHENEANDSNPVEEFHQVCLPNPHIFSEIGGFIFLGN